MDKSDESNKEIDKYNQFVLVIKKSCIPISIN